MNLKAAQLLSKCHRPGNPALQDPQVQKAIRMVEADPAAKAALSAQIAFDDRQAALINAVNPPAEYLKQIDDTLENLDKQGFRWSSLRSPSFLTGAIAVLVVIGVLVYVWLTIGENFPGRESVEKMVETTGRMEAKVASAGELQDWFFNKHYEDFHMLPEFASMKTTGCRVFTMDGHTVAEIALADHGAILYIFPAEDFGVRIDPPEHWRLFQQGEKAVAIRADTDTCFVVTFHGAKSDMQSFVDSLHGLNK